LPGCLYPFGRKYHKVEQKFFAPHSSIFNSTFIKEDLFYPLKQCKAYGSSKQVNYVGIEKRERQAVAVKIVVENIEVSFAVATIFIKFSYITLVALAVSLLVIIA